MKRSNFCRLTYGAGAFGECELRFGLADEDRFYRAVSDLKAQVRTDLRRFDSEARCWRFPAYVFDIAEAWARRWFAPSEITEERPQARYSPPPPRPAERRAGDPFAALHLLPTAPPELVAAAYRTLAKLHHPDAGGSNEAMAAINAAVEILRQKAQA